MSNQIVPGALEAKTQSVAVTATPTILPANPSRGHITIVNEGAEDLIITIIGQPSNAVITVGANALYEPFKPFGNEIQLTSTVGTTVSIVEYR